MENKNIFQKMCLTLVSVVMCVSSSIAAMINDVRQDTLTLTVDKAGSMIGQLTKEEANNVTCLVLKGKINAIDFRYLRDDFHKLATLDLSEAKITAYMGKDGTVDGFHVYSPNSIPASAFCKNTSAGVGSGSLKHVILSENITVIRECAFKGCKNLKTMQIKKVTPPVLEAEALADSLTAVFVPAGCADKYTNKQAWNEFVVLENEPVEVNLQIGMLDNLGNELQRKSVSPKEICFLTIEGKLDDADFKIIQDMMPNLVYINLRESNASLIPQFTFSQKKYLLKITLPKSLKKIGQRAFSGCRRMRGDLILPATMTTIEYGAFNGCDNLHRVIATGHGLTAIGDDIFGNSGGTIVYSENE